MRNLSLGWEELIYKKLSHHIQWRHWAQAALISAGTTLSASLLQIGVFSNAVGWRYIYYGTVLNGTLLKVLKVFLTVPFWSYVILQCGIWCVGDLDAILDSTVNYKENYHLKTVHSWMSIIMFKEKSKFHTVNLK